MLPVLSHFMQQARPEYLLCRCRAVESAGILVDALGAQDPHLGPSIPSMVEAVLMGFTTTDSPDLRDYSHTMFANVAKALGEGFEPWLSRVVPLAVQSCEQEDCDFGSEEGSDGDASEADDDDCGEFDSSSEGEDGRGHFNVRTGECSEGLHCKGVELVAQQAAAPEFPAPDQLGHPNNSQCLTVLALLALPSTTQLLTPR